MSLDDNHKALTFTIDTENLKPFCHCKHFTNVLDYSPCFSPVICFGKICSSFIA